MSTAPRALIVGSALLALAAAGCNPTYTPMDGAVSLEVQLLTDPWAGPETPYDFSSQGLEFDITVSALDLTRQVDASFTRDVALRVVPGEIVEIDHGGQVSTDPVIRLTGGEAQDITVTIANSFGPTHIWVEDIIQPEGVVNGQVIRPTFITGVTPTIHFWNPTILDIQTVEGVSTSNLDGEFTRIRGSDEERELVVTHITQDGFYVSDTTDVDPTQPVGDFRGLFAFSFNRPEDLFIGDRLKFLAGGVHEFYWFTEISFPTWDVEGDQVAPPPPTELTPAQLCDDSSDGRHEMEALESTLVRINRVRANFTAEDCESYLQFGQWPVTLLDEDGEPLRCPDNNRVIEVLVVSGSTVPALDFPECRQDPIEELPELELDFVGGMLRNHQVARPNWLLDVRGCEDIPEGPWAEDCVSESNPPAIPPSGPRPHVDREWRELPGCIDPYVY